MGTNKDLILLQLLAARLERLSVDSRWARRAMGTRGNIIKTLEEGPSRDQAKRYKRLIKAAFSILNAAAQEIPERQIE